MTDEEENEIEFVADVVEALLQRGISSDEHLAVISELVGLKDPRPSKERMLELTAESRFIDTVMRRLRPVLEEAWDDYDANVKGED
jgi:hypothetical protein